MPRTKTIVFTSTLAGKKEPGWNRDGPPVVDGSNSLWMFDFYEEGWQRRNGGPKWCRTISRVGRLRSTLWKWHPGLDYEEALMK